PRCSAKLPKTCGCTSPITRSGSILMRAGPDAAGWAASGGGPPATTAAAARTSTQRCRFMHSLLGGLAAESLFAHDPRPLPNDDEVVGGDAADPLGGAARPCDRQLRGRRRSQPEVQAAVVGGIEARLRRHLLRLRAASVAREHPRADRAAVRLDPDEKDLQPVAAARD